MSVASINRGRARRGCIPLPRAQRGSPDPAATKTIYPDGTLRDFFSLRRGFWEAKGTDDDLDVEISKKIAKGYPLNNTIFEDTRTAVLYQNGTERYRLDLTDPKQLASLLSDFYAYTEPEIDNFECAVAEFQERVPELAKGLVEKITAAHKTNKKLQAAFDDLSAFCRITRRSTIRQTSDSFGRTT